MLPNNKSFCILPWIHLYSDPVGDVRLCCESPTVLASLSDMELSEIWNSPDIKQTRLSMLAGSKVDACSRCYNNEKYSGTSTRLTMLAATHISTQQLCSFAESAIANTAPDGTVNSFNLHYIDFRFTNMCNFKCRTCGPACSSSIATEGLYPATKDSINKHADKMYAEFVKQYPTVKRIYFAGGEPMMQPHHWQVLDDLVRLGLSKDIRLIYNTNGSKLSFKNYSAVDYWAKFKYVTVSFSLDAIGTAASYWRNGSVWEDIERNIRQCRERENIRVCITSTVSWPNVFSWISLVKQSLETKLVDQIGARFLTHPDYWSLQSIPDFKKIQIHKALDELITFVSLYPQTDVLLQDIKDIICYMNAESTPHLINKMDIKLVDISRNESFLAAFPEHEDMREYIE